MPPTKKPKVTVLPPEISISKKSTKYDLYVDVRWGDFKKELKLTKEAGGLVDRVIDEVSKSLLEALEITQPYI
jgi:hypothetical protein